MFGRRGHKMRDILSKYQFIKSKRQPYNLKRLATKVNFTSNESRSVTKCKRPNCGLCIHLKEAKTITKSVKICREVKNVIYVVKCSGCGEEYIGETGNFFRKRVTVHNQQIPCPQTGMLKVTQRAHDVSITSPQRRCNVMHRRWGDVIFTSCACWELIIKITVRKIYIQNIVDSRYLEFQGTIWNTSRYPYFDIPDLQNWGKTN